MALFVNDQEFFHGLLSRAEADESLRSAKADGANAWQLALALTLTWNRRLFGANVKQFCRELCDFSHVQTRWSAAFPDQKSRRSIAFSASTCVPMLIFI